MDPQTILNLAFSLGGILGGMILKIFYDKLNQLQSTDEKIAADITEIKVKLPSEYVHKDDFQHLTDVLFEKLDRIEAKLDNKADKK